MPVGAVEPSGLKDENSEHDQTKRNDPSQRVKRHTICLPAQMCLSVSSLTVIYQLETLRSRSFLATCERTTRANFSS